MLKSLVFVLPLFQLLNAHHGLTLRPVLLAGTNFSDLKGSWIWRVLILSLATRTLRGAG